MIGAALIAGATTPAAAQEIYAVYQVDGDNASLAQFDVTDGELQTKGPHLQSGGGGKLTFDDAGAIAFGIDNSFWSVRESGNGDAALGHVDPATGAVKSGGGYLDAGGDILSFEEVGAIAFAPTGAFWVLFESGTEEAIFAQFNPLTGTRKSGSVLLKSEGSALEFDQVGSMFFSSDGEMWGVFADLTTGNAMLGNFDGVTGERKNALTFIENGGESLLFSEVGAMEFGPDGNLWGLIESGTAKAILKTFNPLTGQSKSGGHYLTSFGQNVDFNDIGAMAFRYDMAAPGVPEPGAWAMLLIGFGAMGASLRNRKVAMA